MEVTDDSAIYLSSFRRLGHVAVVVGPAILEGDYLSVDAFPLAEMLRSAVTGGTPHTAVGAARAACEDACDVNSQHGSHGEDHGRQND